MIRSESEYKNAVERVEAEKMGLADRMSYLLQQGFTSDEVERGVSALRAMHRSLVDDVELYAQIKRHDFGRFENLRDLGRLLVAARVANGLTGREFANQIGVSESQVSRDERNEYNGVTVERACKILEALRIEVLIECQSPPVCQEFEEVTFDVPRPSYEPPMMEYEFVRSWDDSANSPRAAA